MFTDMCHRNPSNTTTCQSLSDQGLSKRTCVFADTPCFLFEIGSVLLRVYLVSIQGADASVPAELDERKRIVGAGRAAVAERALRQLQL